MTESAPQPPPDLDIPKLHALPSEQQDLYLLTFTGELVRFVDSLDGDEASAHQVHIKRTLFNIVGLAKPAPSRVIRNNLGRCYAALFAKGNRKLLFESINELVALAGGTTTSGGKGDKGEGSVSRRHASIHCLGSIYEIAGDGAVNLSTLVCTTLIKALKNSGSHAGIRASIFRSLGKVYIGIGSSADETAARDVWRQARSAASSEKSLAVQAQACYCLEQLTEKTTYFDNSNDFEKLLNALHKAIESSSSTVRHAAASCWSKALVKSYSEAPTSNENIVKPKRPKKAAKKAPKPDADDEEIERPESPAPQKPSTALSFNLSDILKQLSNHFYRPATSNKARAAIAIVYIKSFRELGEGVIENQYGNIARHLFNDILSHPSILNNRYRSLLARNFVKVILEDVIGREILGESAQLRAASCLINEVLKDYPQTLKERPEPTKQALVGALSALASLIHSLGDAFEGGASSDPCRDALLQVLTHPSYTVQVYAAHALKVFVYACPQQLLLCVTACMNSLNRELGQLSTAWQTPKRCVGLANGVAAILSVSTDQPLYGSVDVFSRVLQQATQLLKSSSNSDIRISSTQIQVAWILLGGLMTLGPSFVKIHTSQLLLLWKNALKKPQSREHMAGRNMLELSFLAHIQECALGSILLFAEYNRRLLTLDVTKRLAAMLHNTTVFLASLPSKKTTEDMAQRLSPALQLYDFDIMVRRRVLQCYASLIVDTPQHGSRGGVNGNEVQQQLLQPSLLPLTLSCFALPEDYAPSSISAAIASSAGTFESIWDVGDNYGFGVTSLVNGFDIERFPGESEGEDQTHWISEPGSYSNIERALLSPVGVGREHDSLRLYLGKVKSPNPLPEPPATQVVNAAIHLFAVLFPLQPSRVQESVLEQLKSFLTDGSLQRDPARKMAISVNSATALLGALKVAVRETSLAPGDVRSDAVEELVKEILRVFLTVPDPYIRNLAAQALGRLSKASGGDFTIKEVDDLIELIINNREPSVRSGCALALGHIYARLGGMAAGLHLKKILGVLNSLSSDPHPTVHVWALESISRLANSAGLNFAPYVSSTLGLLAQLYMSDTHNNEVGSATFSNLEVELPTQAVIARCIGSVVNVLGPDLQDAVKTRELIFTLIERFQAEDAQDSSLILIECLRCQEHLSLYAPNHVDRRTYVGQLQRDLDSPVPRMRSTALDGLYNLMRRDVNSVLEVAHPGLEDKLWLLLDHYPENEVIKNILTNWLHQTGLQETAKWVQRYNNMLTKITLKKSSRPNAKKQQPTSSGPDLQDEEIAGFAAAAGAQADDEVAAGAGSSSQELMKWQTRTYAMDLLAELLSMVERDAEEHMGSEAEQELQGKVGEVIRLAFSAATTTGVIALRIRGLQIINRLLKMFGETPDPEYPDVPLLQQHQAQISSALNPAFGADSSAELAAEAVSVCATFVSAGIVTEIKQMTRILSLLASALDSFSASQTKGEDDKETVTPTATIGELKGLSSNAMVMVKMSIFSAWAELQVASSSADRKYLKDAVKPKVAKLTPLWLESLREYARLRFEPDISMAAGAAPLTSNGANINGANLDIVYAALNRETLLQFYQSSWLKLVEAIASLIDEDSEFVFDALDGKTDLASTNGDDNKSAMIPYRNEPVAFFFVLFGLAFEALAGKTVDSGPSRTQTLEILTALKKILRPAVSGNAIYQEVIFSETMDLLDRLVLTESLDVQMVIVDIARNLCLEHPSARKSTSQPEIETSLSDDIDQLFELTRIMVLVITNIIPSPPATGRALTDEAVSLVTSSLTALVDATAVFPPVIETDLHACIAHIFCTILSSPIAQESLVPQTLPILRRFFASLTKNEVLTDSTRTLFRASLFRFLAIVKRAQAREDPVTAPMCEKNALMAATLLFGVCAPWYSAADGLVKAFGQMLGDCLVAKLTGKVAAGCIKSILVPGRERCAVDDVIAADLLPQLLWFASGGAAPYPEDNDTEDEDEDETSEEDEDEDDELSDPEVEETRGVALRALPALVSASPTMLPIIIPTLLARARSSNKQKMKQQKKTVYQEVAARIGECAVAAGHAVFAAAVGGLSPRDRKLLEEVVREGGGVSRKTGGEEKPAIALKMDFLGGAA